METWNEPDDVGVFNAIARSHSAGREILVMLRAGERR